MKQKSNRHLINREVYDFPHNGIVLTSYVR